jgi:hypothetical protein
MGTLCKLLLNLLVQGDISFQSVDLLLHLVVFVQQLLGLFGLVI